MTELLDQAIAALSQLSDVEQDAIARQILGELVGKQAGTTLQQPPKIQRIYTDGACSGNPGPGGWGTVIYFTNGAVHEMGGADAKTTNNRMEMQAAVAALQYLKASGQTDPIELYTDSEYVKNGITQWIKGWKKKGWKTATGKPVLNPDLWQALDSLNSPQVQWRYVRGHSGDVGNERCDTIARAFSLGKTPTLKQLRL